MDINDFRSLLTLLLFLGFNTLMVLVILKGKDAYKDAANLPFEGAENDE